MKPPFLVTVIVFGIASLSFMLYMGHGRYDRTISNTAGGGFATKNEQDNSALAKQNGASGGWTATPELMKKYPDLDVNKLNADLAKMAERARRVVLSRQTPDMDKVRADAVKKGFVTAESLEQMIRKLDTVKSNPQHPQREEMLKDLYEFVASRLLSYKDEIYISEELQKYYLQRKEYSPELALIAALNFRAMGDHPRAIEVLKAAIIAVQREDLAIKEWGFGPVSTPSERAATVKDMQKEISECERGMSGIQEGRPELKLPPESGEITDLDPVRVAEGGDVVVRHGKAVSAAMRGDLAAAIKIFSSINDRENVAACKLRETLTEPRDERLRMLDAVYRDYADTVQGQLALVEKAKDLRQSGDTKQAMECLQRYLAGTPHRDTTNNVLLSLGQMQQEAGKTKDAIESFKQLHEQYQKDGWVGLEIVTTLADLLKQEGRQEEGAAVLDTALSNLENQRAEISSVAPMMEINKVRSMENFRQFIEDYKKAGSAATGRQSQQ